MDASRRVFLLSVAGSDSATRMATAFGAVGKIIWSISHEQQLRIECDRNAPEPVRFAAAGLKDYLGRILRGSTEGAGRQRRHIVLRKINDRELGDEGFEISCNRTTLTISGGASGIVYGAFEFLRRFGGCHFSGLGPDCEHVPQRERIDVDTGRLRMKPKLWYRGYQFYYGEPLELMIQRLDWMVKNGLNYVMFTPHRDDKPSNSTDPFPFYSENWWKSKLQQEVLKRGLKLDFNHHNLFYWLPPHRYFQQHPEWYPLVGGKRTAEQRQLAMCTSNEEAVGTLIANVKRYLRENPDTRIVGVIVEDGGNMMCQCANCVKGDPDARDAFRVFHGYRGPDPENKSKSMRYARLVNRVARAIHREFPKVLVGHCAYIDIHWPPRGVKLEPNVMTWVGIYWRDNAHPHSGTSDSPTNRFFMDILKQWRAVHPGHLTLYEDYIGTETEKSLPHPMSEVVCRDWPNLKKLGIAGAALSCGSASHNSYGLNNLAFARSGWQDQVDHEALLTDYLVGMFGSVAGEIRQVFQRMVAAIQRVEKEGPGVSPWLAGYRFPTPMPISLLPDGYSTVYLLDQVGVAVLQQSIGRASDMAANERERRQVAAFAAVATYWRKAADALAADLRSRQAEKNGDRTLAASLNLEALERVQGVVEYLNTLPAHGWISVMTPEYWSRVSRGLRNRASQLSRA